MSLFNDITRDLKDLLTQRAFDIDNTDPTIPLETKMGDYPHIYLIAGPVYIQFGVMRLRNSRIQVMEFHQFSDDGIADRMKLLQTALRSPKWQELMGRYKRGKRRFLLSYYPEKGEGIYLSEHANIPVMGSSQRGRPVPQPLQDEGKDTPSMTFDQRGKWLEFWLRENPTALIESLNINHQPEMMYGVVPIEALGGHFLFPTPQSEIEEFVNLFKSQGEVLKVSLAPLNLFSAAMREGLQKTLLGIWFMSANGVLTAYGWSKAKGTKPVLRVVAMAQGTAIKNSPKESQLGRALALIIKTWTNSCKVQHAEGLAFSYVEQDEIAEHSLSKVLLDVVPNQRNAIAPFHFSDLEERCITSRGTELPPFDVLTLTED